MSRPESIENRWDILYRDYPEVYEAFSNVPYYPTIYEQISGFIDLRNKYIADVGAGTGLSSLALANDAQNVIGLEREPAMLQQARHRVQNGDSGKVSFLCADAQALPLVADSVDLVTAITLALYLPGQYREFIPIFILGNLKMSVRIKRSMENGKSNITDYPTIKR